MLRTYRLAWLVGMLGLGLGLPLQTAHAADGTLTVLVRDADGNVLEGVWLSVYLPNRRPFPAKWQSCGLGTMAG